MGDARTRNQYSHRLSNSVPRQRRRVARRQPRIGILPAPPGGVVASRDRVIRKATTGRAAPLPADRTVAGNLGWSAISGPAWRQPTLRSQVRGAVIGPADRDRGAHPHASRRTIALTSPDRSKRSVVRARPVKLRKPKCDTSSGGPTWFGRGSARSQGSRRTDCTSGETGGGSPDSQVKEPDAIARTMTCSPTTRSSASSG